MNTNEHPQKPPQSMGGKATAIKLRQEALAKYYSDPNRCKNCHSIIEVRDHEKVRCVKLKRFCNHSCAASFAAKLKPRIKKLIRCKKCGADVACKNGYVRKLCDACLSICRKENMAKIDRSFRKNVLGALTKGELFRSRKNYQSARSTIRKHAYDVFVRSGQALKCNVCGYDKYSEVCHRRDVSDFPSEATLKEINDINNLLSLCPNHHWEFDNNLLHL